MMTIIKMQVYMCTQAEGEGSTDWLPARGGGITVFISTL